MHTKKPPPIKDRLRRAEWVLAELKQLLKDDELQARERGRLRLLRLRQVVADDPVELLPAM